MSERKQALRYISEVRDHLRLQGWNIHLHEDEGDCGDDSWAMIRPDENHHSASLWLSDAFFDLGTQAVKTNVVVHELIHLMHRDLGDLVQHGVVDNSALSYNEVTEFERQYHVHMERFVSWVAGLLAPTCPQWPGTYKKPSAGVCMAEDVSQA